MTRQFLTLLFCLFGLSSAHAVEVGDIMYHDQTFSPTYIGASSAKMPIGVVFWTYPSKDHGLIMALNQPVDDTFANAKVYCENYTTLNFNVGSWRLPDRYELMHMAKQSWNGVSDDKFNVLNKKLATITGVGEQLKSGNYHSMMNSNYGYPINLSTGVLGTSRNSSTIHFRCIMAF